MENITMPVELETETQDEEPSAEDKKIMDAFEFLELRGLLGLCNPRPREHEGLCNKKEWVRADDNLRIWGKDIEKAQEYLNKLKKEHGNPGDAQKLLQTLTNQVDGMKEAYSVRLKVQQKMISRLSPAKCLKYTESVIKFIEEKRKSSYDKARKGYENVRNQLERMIDAGSSQAKRLKAVSKTLKGKTKENVEIVSSKSLGELAGALKSYRTSTRYFTDMLRGFITGKKTVKQRWFAQGKEDLKRGVDTLVKRADAMKIEETKSSKVLNAAGVIKVRYDKIKKGELAKVGAKTHQEIIDEKLKMIEKGLGVTPPTM
jgi:hypothetical protein